MSVRVRPYRNGGFEVDISVLLADGTAFRERKVQKSSKSVAQRWGENRERFLLTHGRPAPKKEVPTLKEFAPRFLDGHARANRHKPSGIAAKESIIRVHLIPALGTRRLDQITTEHVQLLKQRLATLAPKTVNNTLTVLSTLLRRAVDWNVIAQMPCVIRLVKAPKPSMAFYDFETYTRIVRAAEELGAEAKLVVLLAGDAGLRCGEIIALEWQDVDLQQRQLCIQRGDWRGHVTAPKGGRLRYVPMTERLTAALRAHRHGKSRRVLCRADGSSLTQDIVGEHVRRAGRKAKVPANGAHRLRHTFCSHLAMRGAAPLAIQGLAGHQDQGTTQRYLHLTPAALEGAIRLLEQGQPPHHGDSVETTSG